MSASSSGGAASARAAIITNNVECEKHLQYYSTLERYLRVNGWTIATDFEVEWVLICACGFHDFMVKKIEAALAELERRDFPAERIVLLGCLPGTHAGGWSDAFPGRVVPAGREDQLDELLAARVSYARIPTTHIFDVKETTYHIKIAQGCLSRCTFCVINRAKGPLRSVPAEEIRDQFSQAVERGHRKFFLMAEDTFAYGTDLAQTAQGETIIELLRSLLALAPRVELRLGCLHARWLQRYADELVALCEGGAIKELQVGLQHVDEDLLRRMGRSTRVEEVLRALERLKRRCPELMITVDIMVGFPGETEATFARLLAFFEQDRIIDQVSHFGYSDVEGAPSASLEHKVDPLQIALRWERLRQVLGPRSLYNEGGRGDPRYRQAYLQTFEDRYTFCRGTYVEEA